MKDKALTSFVALLLAALIALFALVAIGVIGDRASAEEWNYQNELIAINERYAKELVEDNEIAIDGISIKFDNKIEWYNNKYRIPITITNNTNTDIKIWCGYSKKGTEDFAINGWQADDALDIIDVAANKNMHAEYIIRKDKVYGITTEIGNIQSNAETITFTVRVEQDGEWIATKEIVLKIKH